MRSKLITPTLHKSIISSCKDIASIVKRNRSYIRQNSEYLYISGGFIQFNLFKHIIDYNSDMKGDGKIYKQFKEETIATIKELFTILKTELLCYAKELLGKDNVDIVRQFKLLISTQDCIDQLVHYDWIDKLMVVSYFVSEHKHIRLTNYAKPPFTFPINTKTATKFTATTNTIMISRGHYWHFGPGHTYCKDRPRFGFFLPFFTKDAEEKLDA